MHTGMLFSNKKEQSTTESRLVAARGWQGWEVSANGYGVSFWGDENTLKLNMVMVVQLCQYTKNY